MLGFTVIPTAASRPDSVDAFIMTFLAASSLLVPSTLHVPSPLSVNFTYALSSSDTLYVIFCVVSLVP